MIFFLDDNEASNFYHGQLLKKMNYIGNVNFASTIKMLYQYLLQENQLKDATLLVLDYNLPDGKGEEVVDLLMSQYNFQGNIIVASSSALPNEVLTRLERYENLIVAEKPLRKELFEDVLN